MACQIYLVIQGIPFSTLFAYVKITTFRAKLSLSDCCSQTNCFNVQWLLVLMPLVKLMTAIRIILFWQETFYHICRIIHILIINCFHTRHMLFASATIICTLPYFQWHNNLFLPKSFNLKFYVFIINWVFDTKIVLWTHKWKKWKLAFNNWFQKMRKIFIQDKHCLRYYNLLMANTFK